MLTAAKFLLKRFNFPRNRKKSASARTIFFFKTVHPVPQWIFQTPQNWNRAPTTKIPHLFVHLKNDRSFALMNGANRVHFPPWKNTFIAHTGLYRGANGGRAPDSHEIAHCCIQLMQIILFKTGPLMWTLLPLFDYRHSVACRLLLHAVQLRPWQALAVTLWASKFSQARR